MFDDEKNLLTYVDRIVKDVEKACSVIDWNLNMIKKEAIESLTFTLKNYIKDNDDESEDEHIETEAQAQFEQEEK